ncbi:MAG: GTPase RsgA [Clostridia bacterium]|nr:GTPase RsgA [Clostridia bacterium]
MQGRIIKAISGFFYVECNGNTYECKAKGIFRKKEETPVVGDIVEFDEINEKEGNVISIGERKNILVRPPISNIDIVIIVAAIKIPAISTLFIDKQLAYLRNK